MFNFKFDIDLAPLQGLKSNVMRNCVRRAMRSASKPIKDAVKSKAQSLGATGKLAKSISYKDKSYPNTIVGVIHSRTNYQVSLGTYTKGKRKGQDKIYKPSKIGKIVELGSKRTKAKPYLQPALTANEVAFRENLASTIRENIASELQKYNK